MKVGDKIYLSKYPYKYAIYGKYSPLNRSLATDSSCTEHVTIGYIVREQEGDKYLVLPDGMDDTIEMSRFDIVNYDLLDPPLPS